MNRVILSTIAAAALVCACKREPSSTAAVADPSTVSSTTAQAKLPLPPARLPPPDVIARDARAEQAFALRLYQQASKTQGNLSFSPASIRMALAMAYQGARSNTADEMRSALGFDTAENLADVLSVRLSDLNRCARDIDQSCPLTLRTANQLWVDDQKMYRPEFLSLLDGRFAAPLQRLTFRSAPEPSRKAINQWVDQRTEHRIVDLLPVGSVTHDTRMVVTNAIYLKAAWQHPFSPILTQEGPLYGPAQVNVKLMTQSRSLGYADTAHAHMVELPYGSDLSMVVVVPKARDGLSSVEADLSVAMKAGGLAPRQVKMVLPRFSTASTLSLGTTLAAMGMPSAFDQNSADFSGMDGTRELFLGAVVHKAFVKVDEQGTEAAAASAVGMEAGGLPPEPVEVRADHPFLFFIRDGRSGSTLFMGRVVDPTAV